MITDVHGIAVKRNNLEIKTNTLVLTFNSPKIPDSLQNVLFKHYCVSICTESY